MSTRPLPERMTADEFLAWAEAQPSGRYELIGGVVVQMPGERVAHNRAKAAAAGIATRILQDGSLRLDPPGLDVTIESLFPER